MTNRLSGFCKTDWHHRRIDYTLKALVTYLNCNLSLCPGAHADADLRNCFKMIGPQHAGSRYFKMIGPQNAGSRYFKMIGPRSASSRYFKMIGLRRTGFVVNPIKAVPILHSWLQSSTPAWRRTVGPRALGIKILLLFASKPLLVSDLGCRLFRVQTRGILPSTGLSVATLLTSSRMLLY